MSTKMNSHITGKAWKVVPRKLVLHVNPYQRPIIRATMLPVLFFSVFITIFIVYFHKEMTHYILYASVTPSIDFINKWSIFILVAIWVLFIAFLYRAYAVSSQTVGAFERLIRNLDGIIKDGYGKSLKARQKDKLANDLLLRINELIKKGYDAPPGENHSSSSIGRF